MFVTQTLSTFFIIFIAIEITLVGNKIDFIHLDAKMSAPSSPLLFSRASPATNSISPSSSTLKVPTLSLQEAQEDAALSPRSRDAKRKLRKTRTSRRHIDTGVTEEIFAIDKETEDIQQKIHSVEGDTSDIAGTNKLLTDELSRLREELAAVQKKDVSLEDEQIKKLQRALNARQRDINVMEREIGKLDRQANKYRNYTVVLSQVIQTMMRENVELKKQYQLERDDITPESLQYASELIFKKLFDKLGALSLTYVFLLCRPCFVHSSFAAHPLGLLCVASDHELDDTILKNFDNIEFQENDFDYLIPKPEPPPKTDNDDDD